MLPGNTSNTLVGNFVRAQQGVLETVRVSPDDLRLTVGEKVQALVTNQLNNGRFAVLIKDQLLDLNLPRNTQPGEQLELTVLSKDPQLTFRLNANVSQQAQSPTNLQNKDANVALSKAASMIGSLLEQDSPVAELKNTQPLFAGKPDTAQLAGQLASRLAQSGLFYESHQAEWVGGDRSLHSLLKEPQAALSPTQLKTVDQSTKLPTENQTTKQLDADSNQSNAKLEMPVSDKVAMPERREFLGKVGLENSNTQQVLDDAGLKQIVRQQLDLLENKPLVWQGQAWPGQALRWEMELENERQNDSEGGAESQRWQTRLNLDLPTLGELGVVAQLQAGQLSLRFNAKSEATLALLKQQQPELYRRFEAAGLTLVSSQVEHNDET